MPGIKKKWIKASHNDQVAADLPIGETADVGEEDRELTEPDLPDVSSEVVSKVKKRPAQSGPVSMLKYLDSDVLLEKRKRFIPPAELKLNEWIDNNLEQRTDETLNMNQLYNYFTEICQGEANIIVDKVQFMQIIKRKFGKAFGLKEGSIYKSVIKERKLHQEKKKPTGGISLKDAAYEAINFYNNPWGGVRFFNLKQYIGSKYPGLRIDIRPKSLKRTLEVQQYHGKIDLVRGVGMAGFYKIPGGEEPPPKPKKVKKEEGEQSIEDVETNEDDVKKKSDKDKNMEKEDSEAKENGVEIKDEKDEEESAPKKTSRPKKVNHVEISQIPHGNPQKIEDTFPLAITYQSAPKVVGTTRIRKYITDKYDNEVPDSRWKSAIERGVDKGWWEHASKSGTSGTGCLHLLMDDFDPSSDQIEDQICGAIIACHEPKSASAGSIKKYITNYHPDFNLDNRPDKFKKALIRAIEKNIIVQLSGLGATGSFALTGPFVPSPTVLAGEDESEDEDDEEEEETFYKPKGTKSRGIPKQIVTSPSRLKAYSGRTKPPAIRGRGRKARVKSYAEDYEDEIMPKKASAKRKGSSKGRKVPVKKQKKGNSRTKAREPSPLTDEEEEEEVEENEEEEEKKKPAKGKKSPPKKRNSKARQRSLSPLTDEEVEDEPEAEYTPKLNKRTAKAEIVKGKGLKMSISTSDVSSSRSRERGAKQSYAEESDDDDDSNEPIEPEYSPKKSRNSSSKSRGKNKAKSNDATDEEEEDNEVAPEYTPKKSKSRGGTASKKRKR